MIRRILLFVVLTAILVTGCVWLADRPGSVTIHWQGWRLDTTVPILLLSIASIIAVILLAQRIATAVWHFPARWLSRRKMLQQRRGYQALSDGLAAVAGGDAASAKKLSATAQKLLHDPQLTGLLAAQAAGLAGDETAAFSNYQSLLSRPETALSGCQGMVALALKRDDYQTALEWSRRAWATGTATGFIAETLFDLQARAGQWSEAELTVNEAGRRKALPKSKVGQLRAVALYERALHLHNQGEDDALTLVLQAHKSDPSFIPAAVLSARLLSSMGKVRRAAAILNDTWQIAPHPDLAQAWVNLVANEAPLDRISRLQSALKSSATSPEGLLVLAHAALDAQLWGLARGYLESLIKAHPSRAAFLLLARLEQEDKNDVKLAAHWTEQAGLAPLDAHWHCTACGENTHDWKATCPHCGRAASLSWVQP